MPNTIALEIRDRDDLAAVLRAAVRGSGHLGVRGTPAALLLLSGRLRG